MQRGRPPRSWSGVVPLLVAVVVIGLDQLTKAAVVNWLGPHATSHRVDVVGTAIGMHYVENTGAAFGVLADRRAVLSVLALLVLGGLLFSYRRVEPRSYAARIGMGLLVGGALGNIIDRVRLGHVVDFIAIGPWPKFNVADSAITVGVLLVAWRSMTGHEPSARSRLVGPRSVSDDDKRSGLAVVREVVLQRSPRNGRRG